MSSCAKAYLRWCLSHSLSPIRILRNRGNTFHNRCFVAHAVAFDSFVVHAKHRAAANHIEATVFLKEFQRRGTFRELRYFIEENQRFPIDKLLRRIQQRNVFNNRRSGISVRDDLFVRHFLREVDFDETLVGGDFCTFYERVFDVLAPFMSGFKPICTFYDGAPAYVSLFRPSFSARFGRMKKRSVSSGTEVKSRLRIEGLPKTASCQRNKTLLN